MAKPNQKDFDMTTSSGRAAYNKAVAKYQRTVKSEESDKAKIGQSKTVKRWKGQAGSKTVYYQGGGKWDLEPPNVKEQLAIPTTEEGKFKQKYPNLDYYDPKNYTGTGADAKFKSDAQLNQLNYNASKAGQMDYYSTGKYTDQSLSDMDRYSNQPKDRTAQSMKIIENLNRAEPVQQSVEQDTNESPTNTTQVIKGNNEISEGLKIANRERKFNDPKYKLSRIQQKLIDSGFTRDELQKLREKNAAWQANRGKK